MGRMQSRSLQEKGLLLEIPVGYSYSGNGQGQKDTVIGTGVKDKAVDNGCIQLLDFPIVVYVEPPLQLLAFFTRHAVKQTMQSYLVQNQRQNKSIVRPPRSLAVYYVVIIYSYYLPCQ